MLSCHRIARLSADVSDNARTAGAAAERFDACFGPLDEEE